MAFRQYVVADRTTGNKQAIKVSGGDLNNEQVADSIDASPEPIIRDDTTGLYHTLYVDNGDIATEETSDSHYRYLDLYDPIGQAVYRVKVTGGDLNTAVQVTTINWLEARVLAHARSVLLANATVYGFTKTNIYDAHVSLISEPVYPAISLMILPGSATEYLPAIIDFSMQVDLWFEADAQSRPKNDMYQCYDAVRSALHRYSVNDGEVNIVQMIETQSGAVLFEPDPKLWHMAKRYLVKAAKVS